MKEKLIEIKVISYLTKLNFKNIKIIHKIGYPDRIFLKDGKVIFIEFKSNDGVLSPVQKKIISILKKDNFKVFIIKDIKDFNLLKKYIDNNFNI